MALELRQQLKLAQQLIMTPQLQQAIKLLQLSRIELLETVQQELLENPFLEEADYEDKALEMEDERKQSQDDDAYGTELTSNADWEDYLGEFASTPRLSQSREFEALEEISSLEARYTAKPTLEGHLLWQLRLSTLTKTQQAIGEVIIGNLASSGYLSATVEEIAEMCRATPAETLSVLDRVQRFDPVGVAARNASECLLIQVKNLHYDRDSILVELIQSHLEDMEAKRYKPLLRKFNFTMEELKEYMDIIQNLEPLPGASFGGGEPTFVSPDIFVYNVDGEFIIELNDDSLPQLRLSDSCKMNTKDASEQDREYCAEKRRSASWLIKAMHQRNRTLYKVAESIVRQQKAFFDEGITKLMPLILKDIADDIDMHESTVSRITTNKYMATPHGIFELKFFFNSGLELDNGTQLGSESVKALIKKYISDEDPKAPLSDERIGDMLKDALQVQIARRTVAKYRTALNIQPSSRRKEHF